MLIFFMTVSLITDARYFTIIPHGDTCASGKEYVKENLPDTGSFRRIEPTRALSANISCLCVLPHESLADLLYAIDLKSVLYYNCGKI